jgi:hypothetical protein
MKYGSATCDVSWLRSLAEEKIADLFSDELSDVPSSTSSGSDNVSGSDRGGPLPVKVTLAPTRVQVVALRGQPHGEK